MGKSLIRVGAVVGLLALGAYFGAAFLPLPARVAYTLVFAMGPLLALSFLGMHEALAAHRRSIAAYFGCALGFAAGVLVNLMLVIQGANNILREEAHAGLEPPAAEQAETVWRSVNRVQFSIDVSWDIFICLAGLLVGIAMLSHPTFGKLLGWFGIASSTLLLALNLYTFPIAPAYAGLVDLGPLVALWYGVVFARMLSVRDWSESARHAPPAPD